MCCFFVVVVAVVLVVIRVYIYRRALRRASGSVNEMADCTILMQQHKEENTSVYNIFDDVAIVSVRAHGSV